MFSPAARFDSFRTFHSHRLSSSPGPVLPIQFSTEDMFRQIDNNWYGVQGKRMYRMVYIYV